MHEPAVALFTASVQGSHVASRPAAVVDPNFQTTFVTFVAQVANSLTTERLLATLSAFFGALAVLLATMDLYGVMSYSVARRRNEIGIRMALGAASDGWPGWCSAKSAY